MRTLLMAAIAALSFAGSASAHHLWLESDGQGARLYFGEFDENLREASPGLLDRFKPLPEAKAVGAAAAVPGSRTAIANGRAATIPFGLAKLTSATLYTPSAVDRGC